MKNILRIIRAKKITDLNFIKTENSLSENWTIKDNTQANPELKSYLSYLIVNKSLHTNHLINLEQNGAFEDIVLDGSLFTHKNETNFILDYEGYVIGSFMESNLISFHHNEKVYLLHDDLTSEVIFENSLDFIKTILINGIMLENEISYDDLIEELMEKGIGKGNFRVIRVIKEILE